MPRNIRIIRTRNTQGWWPKQWISRFKGVPQMGTNDTTIYNIAVGPWWWLLIKDHPIPMRPRAKDE